MPPVNIDVSLDKNGNPAVELTDNAGNSERDKTVTSGDTIRWRKKDNNDDFLIISLVPTGAVPGFSTATLSTNGRWLTSVFDAGNSPDGTPFSYTLTVRSTGLDPQDYDTTGSTVPLVDDRPVIRN